MGKIVHLRDRARKINKQTLRGDNMVILKARLHYKTNSTVVADKEQGSKTPVFGYRPRIHKDCSLRPGYTIRLNSTQQLS